MSRPLHQPTDETRRMVEQHAAVGTLHKQIAKLLGISLNTMKKYYREELDLGLARANAVVASTLFSAARRGNITACIFWMKTRGGWRETSKVEHAGTPGEPIELRPLDPSRLSDATMTELLAARDHAPERR
jgi:hypothetical protein